MDTFRPILVLFSIGIIFASCGVSQRAADPSYGSGAEDDSTQFDGNPVAMSVSTMNKTETSLMQAYRDWKGTPYRLGGGTQRGVDCSMFVNIVFEEYFDIGLPRNTRTQLNVGDGVRRSAIRTGDLVFFRTGRRTLHVGVVINQDEFLHASTSEGVTISELDQKYWSSRYLSARRVL
ncbi:NlpC/P60 family protein [Fodinibius salsisoli]|uniref:C40 family peptidase n=1 Tax=Fodinibius salsisoli TaxID=2820877 RepID=A0ABT3PNQ2_9BACT|nr:NlpC/P60 family protein [Fodinibius salsisoli]MCW9707488.1 C40 family peptidase [Fodinibius salsisoli]